MDNFLSKYLNIECERILNLKIYQSQFVVHRIFSCYLVNFYVFGLLLAYLISMKKLGYEVYVLNSEEIMLNN